MTKMKTLSAVIIFFAALATPVFAQDADLSGPGSRYGLEPQPVTNYRSNYRSNYQSDDQAGHRSNYLREYSQLDGPLDATPRAHDDLNRENFGFGERDPSRVSG
jgi:hypothetical protein